MQNSLKRSFSLIEVLIFTSILSVFFVMAATVTVRSLRDMKVNEHKIRATHLAEELLEYLRNEKDNNWQTFIQNVGTYCFNKGLTTPFSGDTISGPNDPLCPYGWGGNIYKRYVILEQGTSPNYFNVNITVAWQELGNTFQVPLNTVFTVWE